MGKRVYITKVEAVSIAFRFSHYMRQNKQRINGVMFTREIARGPLGGFRGMKISAKGEDWYYSVDHTPQKTSRGYPTNHVWISNQSAFCLWLLDAVASGALPISFAAEICSKTVEEAREAALPIHRTYVDGIATSPSKVSNFAALFGEAISMDEVPPKYRKRFLLELAPCLCRNENAVRVARFRSSHVAVRFDGGSALVLASSRRAADATAVALKLACSAA